MMAFSWYRYTTDDAHEYDLGCEFVVSLGKIHLIGCDLYNMTGEYVGYWDRENIPEHLLREIEYWLHGDASAINVIERARGRRKSTF